MIKGDIDLTENLDFRKDKNELVKYNNSLLFDKSRNSSNHNFKYYGYNDIIDYNYSMDVIRNLDSGFVNTSTNTMGTYSDLRTFSYTTYNELDNTYTYYNYDSVNSHYTSRSYDIRISYNIDNIILTELREKVLFEDLDRNTIIDALFGRKKPKIYYYCADLGRRRQPQYKSSIIRRTGRLKDELVYWLSKKSGMLGIDKQVRRFLNWDNLSGSEYLEALFGTKDQPEEEYNRHKYDNIPWIRDLRRKNRNAYEYYIEGLEDNEKDYSSYLTNMGWLRLH